MKAILIIAHHCILPGAYKGFEGILDKLHHDLPGTRVASTSLLDLENDLRTLLREDVESVTLLPFLLLNGQHSRNDVPRVVAKLQEEFPQIPITLMPCLGDWKEFSDMVVDGIRNAQDAPSSSWSHECGDRIHSEHRTSNLFSIELNLEGRNVLVVGGGRIALRKVKTLLSTGARITVVAPQFDPEFDALKSGEQASLIVLKIVLTSRLTSAAFSWSLSARISRQSMRKFLTTPEPAAFWSTTPVITSMATLSCLPAWISAKTSP